MRASIRASHGSPKNPAVGLLRRTRLPLAATLFVALTASFGPGCDERSSAAEGPLPSSRAPTPVTSPATSAAAPNPIEASKPSPSHAEGIAEGKALFEKTCAACHGPDGSGSAMKSALPEIGDLTSPDLHTRLSDDAFVELLKQGRNKMPPFGSLFTPKELRAIVVYARTLKKS